jgi:hypothetical protein
VWENTAQGQGVLHVTASDADGETLWLQLTPPPGFHVTETIANLGAGGGQTQYVIYSNNATGGALGTVELAVLDEHKGAAFATQAITIAPAAYAPPELSAAYFIDLGDGTGRLYLYVNEPANLPYTVSIAPLAGFSFDLPGAYGTRVLFTALDNTITTSGAAQVTVTSSSGTASKIVPITLAPASSL